MGKKKKAELDAQYETFSAGMAERGFSPAAVKALWDILLPFSDYAFNKSHSAAYGVLSYWTAYLKANYPAEYMAALLTSVRDDKDKSALYLNECRRMGLKVLPPDVNASEANFTPTGTDIRFGLSAIRNVGGNVVESIVRCRRERGRYADFADFLRKVEPVACNKRVVESLIKAGAFDSLGHTRRGLITIHLEAVDHAITTKREEAIGQFDLFGGGDEVDDSPGFGPSLVVAVEEWDKAVLLAFEREMLGLYVSDHPLLGVEAALAALVDTSIAGLADPDLRRDAQIVTVGGLVSGITRKTTRATGEPYAVLMLEDLEGAVEVMVFPALYRQVAPVLAEDAVLVVKGRVRDDEDRYSIMALEVSVPDLDVSRRGPVVVSMPVQRCTPPVVERLKDILRSHPGATEVHLRLETKAGHTVMRLDDGLRVSATSALMGELKALLGPGCVI
jgi:DNA polymerase-3 subunit alpha